MFAFDKADEYPDLAIERRVIEDHAKRAIRANHRTTQATRAPEGCGIRHMNLDHAAHRHAPDQAGPFGR